MQQYKCTNSTPRYAKNYEHLAAILQRKTTQQPTNTNYTGI